MAQTLVDEMRMQSEQYLPIVHHNLSLILHHMLRGLSARQTGEEKNISEIAAVVRRSSSDPVIQQAITYIDQYLGENNLKVEQIAAYLHISPRHLSRIFQREMNLGVMEFVIARRMGLARKLLTESALNVRSIASYTGYASSSSFVKVFQRYYGMSPTAYRLRHENDGIIEQ